MRRLPIATLSLALACSGPPAGPPDAAEMDAALADAAAADAEVPDAAAALRLSEMGVYEDIGEKRLHPDALAYEPGYELWSDGAEKARWLILPEGENVTIDTSDMDAWQFPVGTRMVKEFRVDGVLVETRLIEKTAADEYWMGAFVWNDDESDAVFVISGERDARRSGHDVPSAQHCLDCHDGEAGKILGFSAIQLSHDGEPNLASLAADGLLSDPPDEGVMYPPPGEGATKDALGYLHANCGNCHNPRGVAWADGEMNLRLSVSEAAPEETELYATTIDVPLERFAQPGLDVRVAPGDVEASALYYRMSVTADVGRDRMPPIATREVDDDALATVGAWIESLAEGD